MPRVASADEIGDNQLPIAVQPSPRPETISIGTRGFGVRHVHALAVVERPNLIAFHALGLEHLLGTWAWLGMASSCRIWEGMT